MTNLKELAIETIQQIRDEVWLCDIPSATVPEYIEHHRDIQNILKFIDDKLESFKTEAPDWIPCDERDQKNELLKLIQENQDLPVVPMVDSEIVCDDCGYWLGVWGSARITEYYIGKERVYFKDECDQEDVLNDMNDCMCGYDQNGRDIYEWSDEEWDELFESLPWIRAIVVYIVS